MTTLTEDIFKECIEHAVEKVFLTMLRRQAVPVGGECPVPTQDLWCRPEDLTGSIAVGSVGFTGDISGLVFLYFPEVLTHLITQEMLGMSHAEVLEGGREVVSDVVGEFANMTVGTFKNRFHDMGYPCKLTIPTVVWGTDVTTQPTRGTIRRTYVFKVEGHSVIADLIFKED